MTDIFLIGVNSPAVTRQQRAQAASSTLQADPESIIDCRKYFPLSGPPCAVSGPNRFWSAASCLVTNRPISRLISVWVAAVLAWSTWSVLWLRFNMFSHLARNQYDRANKTFISNKSRLITQPLIII